MLLKKMSVFYTKFIKFSEDFFCEVKQDVQFFERFCFIIIFTNPIVKPPKQHANLKNLGAKMSNKVQKVHCWDCTQLVTFVTFICLQQLLRQFFDHLFPPETTEKWSGKKKLRKYCFANFLGVMIKNLENQLRIDLF